MSDRLFIINVSIVSCPPNNGIWTFDKLINLLQAHNFDKALPYLHLQSDQVSNSANLPQANEANEIVLKLTQIMSNPLKIEKGTALNSLKLQTDLAFRLFINDEINYQVQHEYILGRYENQIAIEFDERRRKALDDPKPQVPIEDIHDPWKSNSNIEDSLTLLSPIPLTRNDTYKPEHKDMLNIETFRGTTMAGMQQECQFLLKNIFLTRMNQKFSGLIKNQNGLLLYGPPGTGKSLLAGVIADFWKKLDPNVIVQNIRGPELFSKWVGETEKQMRELFTSKQNQIKLIIIDEIDAMFPVRAGGEQSAMNNRAVAQFLAVFDGLDKTNSNLFVIGTSNRKDNIDPAVLRNGRLGLHLQVTYQNKESQNEILKFRMQPLLENKILVPQIFDQMVQEFNALATEFSGSEVTEIFENSVLNLINDAENSFMTIEHFEQGIKQVLDKKEEKSHIIKYLLQSHCVQNSSAVPDLLPVNVIIGEESAQIDMTTNILKKHSDAFTSLKFHHAESLLAIDTEQRIRNLLQNLQDKSEGESKLQIVSNVDNFLEAYPAISNELLLIFRNLFKRCGQALLEFKHAEKDEETVTVITMSQAIFKRHFDHLIQSNVRVKVININETTKK